MHWQGLQATNRAALNWYHVSTKGTSNVDDVYCVRSMSSKHNMRSEWHKGGLDSCKPIGFSVIRKISAIILKRKLWLTRMSLTTCKRWRYADMNMEARKFRLLISSVLSYDRPKSVVPERTTRRISSRWFLICSTTHFAISNVVPGGTAINVNYLL